MASTTPTEFGLQDSMLDWFQQLGWDAPGYDVDRHGATILNNKHDRNTNEIIYWDILKQAIIDLNDEITTDNVDQFTSSLKRELDHDNLIDGNQAFHEILTKGKKFTVDQAHNGTKTIYIDLINFDHLTANTLQAVDEFEVAGNATIRPDITLFVNGIPIIPIELKDITHDNDYVDAITDLQHYEQRLPRLFIPALFNVAADTETLRYGAVGASREFYQDWTTAPEQYQSENALKQSVQALMNPETVLDLLKHFVFYEQRPDENGKIVPRHMQYYAVKRILDRVDKGDHRRGLIWHTQGSGKSFTMLYTAKNLLERGVMQAPQLFIVVDTDKLNSQMRDQLSNLSFEQWREASTIADLENIIAAGRSELVVTTIQKFQDVEPDLQTNDETVIMADEAHRFMEKNLGSRLDAALPDAYKFGFTGTPVREGERHKDRNTFREFSPAGEEYLHRYSIKDGIDDELILPVYFRLRHDIEWSIDEAGLDEEFDQAFATLSKDEKLEFIRENVDSRMLAEIEPRVDRVVEEIDQHFEGVEKNSWKGMVVTPSRRSAAMYGQRLIERRGADNVEVLYTANEADPDLIRRFHTDPGEREDIVTAFKREAEPKLLVVHNMLLTGFDAPVLKTMYLDRNLRDHNLMQAIARTNRPAPGKENGEIVDFQGVFEHVDEALDYDEETVQYAAQDSEALFEKLTDQLAHVSALFDGIERNDRQEVINDCLDRVSTHPEKREFKQGFRRLQNLYESVSPDRRIIEQDIDEEYSWLAQIYTAFQRVNNRSETPEQEMREKTREIIEDNVDIGDIKHNYPVYELGEEYLDQLDHLDSDAAKATTIAHAAKETTRNRQQQNPKYKRLSERVNEIVEEWETGNRSDPDAVEALREVEEEILAVESEAEKRGMSDVEFAIFTALTEDHAVEIEESVAEEIARDIVTSFNQRVDTDYDGWMQNQTTLQEIEYVLLDVLVKDHGRNELFTDAFADAAREYLIHNHVNSEI